MILAAVMLFSQLAFAQGAGPAKPRFTELDSAPARFDGARFYGNTPTLPPPPKPELGPIDKWRYDSCQQDAATAPTSQGVVVKLRICRDKFGQ